MDKFLVLALFRRCRLGKKPLYLWLILGVARAGSVRDEKLHDKERARGRKIPKAVLKKLLADSYYNSVEIDIAKVEAIAGASILDIFDDNPALAGFGHLRRLARNREWEIGYYGKVR